MIDKITYNGFGEPLPWEAESVNKNEPEKLKKMQEDVKKWVRARAGRQISDIPKVDQVFENYNEALEIFKPEIKY